VLPTPPKRRGSFEIPSLDYLSNPSDGGQKDGLRTSDDENICSQPEGQS
jgi:hypothetical protein